MHICLVPLTCRLIHVASAGAYICLKVNKPFCLWRKPKRKLLTTLKLYDEGQEMV